MKRPSIYDRHLSREETNPLKTDSSITVAHSIKEEFIMLVEVKKMIPLKIAMVDPSLLIEMLMYVRYLITLKEQKELIGAITDGSTWHHFNLEVQHTSSHLLVKRYVYMSDHDVRIISNVPHLIACLKGHAFVQNS